MPVPDSGVTAALGYAAESGIPFNFGLIRNHYVGRTFIEPEQRVRDFGVKLKLNPVRNLLEGKRIILIEGEPVGAVLRVPAKGEARANLHVGGKAQKSPLSKRDREICAAIGPKLRELGLVFVGIDVIGDYLTEINVTSPTGIQEINRLEGVKLEVAVWNAIEARYKARKRR